MINALTIDLEPWWSVELLAKYAGQREEDQVEEATRPLLKLLDRYRTKATFFVLGIVAEKYPSLVYEIREKGHEIASHAYSHKTLYELGKSQFEVEMEKSVALLESITGEQPIGFRAPSFSINNSTSWALGVLKDYGFKYDSSIFPVKTTLYGVPDAPVHPYKPSMTDVAQEDVNGELIEFPLATCKVGTNIPMAGGFWLRLLPLWFVTFAIKRINRACPTVIYLHPWETYAQTPRMNRAPLFSRVVTYHGIGSMLARFEGLLQRFEFQPLCRFIDGV